MEKFCNCKFVNSDLQFTNNEASLTAISDADESGYTMLHNESIAGNRSIIEILLE